MQTETETIKKNGKLPHNDSDLGAMVHNVSEFGRDMVAASEDKIKTSVQYAKKYPLHTAIGAGLLGFAIGFFSKSSK